MRKNLLKIGKGRTSSIVGMRVRYQNKEEQVTLGRREEDYLEAIYNITREKGYARTTDIADRLGVTPSSVTEMLQKLDSKGFVEYRRYEGVVLTKKGQKIAEAVKGRHDALLELLKILQVPDEVAERDACIMEHGLNPITIIQVKKFVSFVKNCPKGMPEWLEHFKIYSETGKFPIECKK